MATQDTVSYSPVQVYIPASSTVIQPLYEGKVVLTTIETQNPVNGAVTWDNKPSTYSGTLTTGVN